MDSQTGTIYITPQGLTNGLTDRDYIKHTTRTYKWTHRHGLYIAHHKDLQMDSQTGTRRVLTFSLFMYKNKYITTLNM